jgi:predicted XRE-type DNA-binding protein
MTDDPIEIVNGSGNAFGDFGYPDAGVRQAKALLGTQIMNILDAEALSTCQAEARTGVSHSEFSRIRQAKFSRFTIDRLMGILALLGQEVALFVSVHPRAGRDVTQFAQPYGASHGRCGARAWSAVQRLRKSAAHHAGPCTGTM